MARTDSHILVVSNHSTGERFSFAGSEAECRQAAKEKKKVWKGDKTEVLIEKR